MSIFRFRRSRVRKRFRSGTKRFVSALKRFFGSIHQGLYGGFESVARRLGLKPGLHRVLHCVHCSLSLSDSVVCISKR